jgi:hypothetical protein
MRDSQVNEPSITDLPHWRLWLLVALALSFAIAVGMASISA